MAIAGSPPLHFEVSTLYTAMSGTLSQRGGLCSDRMSVPQHKSHGSKFEQHVPWSWLLWSLTRLGLYVMTYRVVHSLFKTPKYLSLTVKAACNPQYSECFRPNPPQCMQKRYAKEGIGATFLSHCKSAVMSCRLLVATGVSGLVTCD